MTPATATMRDEPTVRNCAADAIRQATHVAHEARLFKSLASDAIEDGVHVAKRATTRGLHRLEDLRESATYGIKQRPFTTVGLALGAGVLLGLVFGRISRNAGTPAG